MYKLSSALPTYLTLDASPSPMDCHSALVSDVRWFIGAIYFILFYYGDRTTVHIHTKRKKRLIRAQKLDKTIYASMQVQCMEWSNGSVPL